MEIILAIICFCITFTVVGEFAAYMTHGKKLTDDQVLNYLDRYEEFKLNCFEKSILSGEIDWHDTDRVKQKIIEGDYISYTCFALTTKYYIAGKGTVGRFTRGAREIDRLYKIAKGKTNDI